MLPLGKRLSTAVGALCSHVGFRYMAKRNSFFRKEEYGYSEFLWASHRDICRDVEGMRYLLIIGMRHNNVENAVNRLGLIYGAEDQKFSPTISRSLDLFPISNTSTYSFFLKSSAPDSDVDEVAASIAASIQVDAMPFYARYSSLIPCAIDLNSSPASKTHPLNNNLEQRMYRAVACAHFAKLPNFVSLLNEWRVVSQEHLPPNIREKAKVRLENLVAVLEAEA